MTKLFDDIRRQPVELSKSLAYTLYAGSSALEKAADSIRNPHTSTLLVSAAAGTRARAE